MKPKRLLERRGHTEEGRRRRQQHLGRQPGTRMGPLVARPPPDAPHQGTVTGDRVRQHALGIMALLVNPFLSFQSPSRNLSSRQIRNETSKQKNNHSNRLAGVSSLPTLPREEEGN